MSNIMTVTVIFAATLQVDAWYYFPKQQPTEQFKIRWGYQVEFIEQEWNDVFFACALLSSHFHIMTASHKAATLQADLCFYFLITPK